MVGRMRRMKEHKDRILEEYRVDVLDQLDYALRREEQGALNEGAA